MRDGSTSKVRAPSAASGYRGNGIGGAGPPVDVAVPGEDAGEVGHHGRDRHDRNGLLRSVFIDQDRHQHDRGAGADDAGDRARNEADGEDEKETQARVLRSNRLQMLSAQKRRHFALRQE
jgi:hypothetical protein